MLEGNEATVPRIDAHGQIGLANLLDLLLADGQMVRRFLALDLQRHEFDPGLLLLPSRHRVRISTLRAVLLYQDGGALQLGVVVDLHFEPK